MFLYVQRHKLRKRKKELLENKPRAFGVAAGSGDVPLPAPLLLGLSALIALPVAVTLAAVIVLIALLAALLPAPVRVLLLLIVAVAILLPALLLSAMPALLVLIVLIHRFNSLTFCSAE